MFQMSSLQMVSANTPSFKRDHLPFVSRLEVSVFIKNIIIGKTGLMCDTLDLLFIKQPRGTLKQFLFSFFWGLRAGLPTITPIVSAASPDAVHCRIAFGDKVFSNSRKSARRIPADAERSEKTTQVGTGCFSLADPFKDLPGVRFEIPNVVVLLG